MNAFQIEEIRRQARLKSKRDSRKVYALIKNGTSMGKVTDNPEVVRHYVEKENFSVWGVYRNGKKVKTA